MNLLEDNKDGCPSINVPRNIDLEEFKNHCPEISVQIFLHKKG